MATFKEKWPGLLRVFFLLDKHFPYELNGFFGGQVLTENSQQYSVDVADGLRRRCFHDCSLIA